MNKGKELEITKMLIDLINEINDSSACYSDIPYVFDLLQEDNRFLEFINEHKDEMEGV